MVRTPTNSTGRASGFRRGRPGVVVTRLRATGTVGKPYRDGRESNAAMSTYGSGVGGAGCCPAPGLSHIDRAARARCRPPAAGAPDSRVLRRAAGRRWAGAVPSTPALRAAGPGPVLARDPGAGAGGAAAAGAGCPDV